MSTPGEGTTLSSGSYSKLAMNGREVYKFATREVPTVLEEALDASGLSVDDVDWLLMHQANIRIMEVVADRLGIPMEKVITNLSDYGNTSAASIPLALDEAVRSGQVKKGDVIACAGFGAGLSCKCLLSFHFIPLKSLLHSPAIFSRTCLVLLFACRGCCYSQMGIIVLPSLGLAPFTSAINCTALHRI